MIRSTFLFGFVQPDDKYLYKIVCSVRALGGVFCCETVDFSTMWSGLYSAFSSVKAYEKFKYRHTEAKDMP